MTKKRPLALVRIFQNPNGKVNFRESISFKNLLMERPISKQPLLGITVVKGKVSEVLGNSPKALSAVDGMAGATLTGNGVTNASRDVLAAYRPFLMHLHDETNKANK